MDPDILVFLYSPCLIATKGYYLIKINWALLHIALYMSQELIKNINFKFIFNYRTCIDGKNLDLHTG